MDTMEDEAKFSRVLANCVLDRVSGDPDDDLAVLARQLLRADEKIAALGAVYGALSQIMELDVFRRNSHLPCVEKARAALSKARGDS